MAMSKSEFRWWKGPKHQAAVLAQMAEEALDRGANRVAVRARAEAFSRPAHASGNLARSITVEKQARLTRRIIANAPYSGWAEAGRGPVRPVRARALRWQSPGGAVIFSQYSRPAAGLWFMRDTARTITANDFRG